MPTLTRLPVALVDISLGKLLISTVVWMCSSETMSDTCSDDKRSGASSRRSNKPLMEKRRRARINECLGQLKSLVLQALKKDSTQYSKLEKADILEMTVKHLKLLQRQQIAAAMSSDPFLMGKYRAGFNECAGEVARYLDAVSVNHDVKSRVLNHLANCVSQIPPEAQIHPAHLQALHVIPQASQPAFPVNSLGPCTPVWNIVPSSVTHQVHSQHARINVSPYSKMDRPRFTPSPESRSLPESRSSPDSSPVSSPDSKSDIDLSSRRQCEMYTPPHVSASPSLISVKRERETTPPRQELEQQLEVEGDKMWRPW
ncbi:transcription factor HES-1-like [Haliotis rufescens]|uniref:transcription factor HES-1-like n=1 Tax=Haliotis rufescens TaxID=6454 RepID=UPI001EAFE21E|nr:transcription factor HES-1-like [Haliotis rufescens]